MSYSFIFSAVAIVSVITLGACSGPESSEKQPESTSQASIEQKVSLESRYQDKDLQTAYNYLEQGDRLSASVEIRKYLENKEKKEVSTKLNALWAASKTQNEQALVVIMAEEMVSKADGSPMAYYIAGLAYHNGISVEKNYAKVIEYWDIPRFDDNQAIQELLAQVYKDQSPDAPVEN